VAKRRNPPARICVTHRDYAQWLRQRNGGPDPDYWLALLHPHRKLTDAGHARSRCEEPVFIVIDEDLIDDEQYGAD